MTFDFSLWDAVLIGVVTIQCLLIAYAESPKWKGLFLTLPLPFTAVVMSVGRPIDASTIAALFVLLVYTQSVRLLSNRLHVPIVAGDWQSGFPPPPPTLCGPGRAGGI